MIVKGKDLIPVMKVYCQLPLNAKHLMLNPENTLLPLPKSQQEPLDISLKFDNGQVNICSGFPDLKIS